MTAPDSAGATRAPTRRDADRIARGDAWAFGLLPEITGPIVLMGHSMAGLYIRAYAARYPENLSGLIFVDSSTPLQEDRLPAELVKKIKAHSFELLETQVDLYSRNTSRAGAMHAWGIVY